MILVPNFYKKFKCIADKCKDSCCIGWEIDLDAPTLEKLQGLSEDFLSCVEIDATPPYIRLDGDERCPFLDARGLCRIISNHGEDFIPEICKRHPRYFNDILDFTECSIGLSCPTAAEIILSIREKPTIEKMKDLSTYQAISKENESKIPTNEAEKVKNIYKIRDRLFDFVFDTERDIAGIVAGLIEYQSEISDYLFFGDAPREIHGGKMESLYGVIDMMGESAERLELLSEEHRPRLSFLTREGVISRLSANADISRSLLYYFLHRHMLSGAMELDLDDRLTLCVLLLFICLCFIDGISVTDEAALFSKNIEYSTENIDILLDIIA